LEPLLASSPATPVENSPNGEDNFCASLETSEKLKPSIDPDSSQTSSVDSVNEYVTLQRSIFRMTFVLTAFTVVFAIIFVDFNAAISLLLGACSGIIYLRLLAKNIGSLGKSSSSVSKVQLLVPVLLVLVVTKLPELQLMPALVGFLLYKPSLIIQFLFEPSA